MTRTTYEVLVCLLWQISSSRRLTARPTSRMTSCQLAVEITPPLSRQDTGAAAALPVGLRFLAKLQAMWNGPKTARVLRYNYKAPYAVQDTTTTLYSAKDNVVIEVTVTVPQACPASHINEAVNQGLNLAASSLIKASATSGYAPT